MRAALAIAAFEVESRLRRISTWVYVALFFAIAVFFVLAAGGAIAGAHVDFGTGGKVFINSPYSIHALSTIIALFGTVVVASIAGQATYQDLEHRTAPLFFTAPITKAEYLAGRFAGAFAISAFVYAAIGLGAAFAMHLPLVDAARLGPPPGALAYVQPYLTVLLPNLFVTVALFFTIGALGRRMLPVYAGSVVLLIGYLIALNLSDDVENKRLVALLDPFGLVATDRVTEYFTIAERNARRVPLEGVLLQNRAIWLAVGAACVVLVAARFSFSRAASAAARAPSAEPAAAPPSDAAAPGAVALDFSRRATLGVFSSLTRLQLTETVKSVVFLVLVLAGILFMVSTSQSVGRLYGTTTWPVTYEVLEILGGSFQVFILAIVTFYAGELVWRERDAKLAQILDAMPTPGWVVFASKWVALALVEALLLAIVLVTGVAMQAAKGYHHHEIGLYLRWLFGMRLVDLAFLSTLALAVHAIVDDKYLGHFAMVAFFVAEIALPLLGFEHRLYRFGSQPDWTYSDMNGFGPYVGPIVALKLYWGAASIVLAAVTRLAWVRGVDGGLRVRLRIARSRLTRPVALALAIGGGAFVAIGGFLFYQFDVLHRYRTKFDREELTAGYEKKYKAAYRALAPPRVRAVEVDAAIYPEERRLVLTGHDTIENAGKTPIDRVLVRVPERARVDRLAFDRGERLAVDDRPAGVRIYELGRPLAPAERAELSFSIAYAARGLEQDRGDVLVAENGTFVNDQQVLPQLGYAESEELSDDEARKKHGLAPKPRMRDLDDPSGLSVNYVSNDSDFISFDATVSTSLDQIAIAPGYLAKEWVEGGRRRFHYTMDAKILGFYSFLSARYAVKRDAWNGVAIEVDYHPTHAYDVDRMIRGVKASLDDFTRAFGPYQHRLVRIVEFPRYERFAQSFPNTIPYSESIGFIARVDDSKPDEIDYPFFVTAHEVAHQWWAHQVIGGAVQGATLLSETCAQYSAFMVMKHAYGERAMRRFLRYELDTYLRGRASERKKELPLIRVEDQTYIHYAKGALVMYALQDAMGEERVNRALRRFLDATKFKGPPYPNARELVAALRREAPESALPLIDDGFERITLYELRAKSAKAKALGDGRWEVTVEATAKKLYAGDLGDETEAPLDQEIPFGALDEDGNALTIVRERVTGPDAKATFDVDKKPAKAGIDPLDMLIDRMPDDNVVAVEVE
ncbi:MAG TPA: M1 family aminopeptidase [Minicystis sp.]|nr:M1 family aminopeptidase [Minicystis sp.]